jgi:two-component system, NarL family, response regulator LiaR
MKKAEIRVLVVDDHPIVRRGLCTEINLDPEMQVVGEARDGIEAVALEKELNPDVILMDLIMPQKNGVEATAEIIAANPAAKILILTSFSEEDKIVAAIKAGAIGSIMKDRPSEALLQAIKDTYEEKSRMDAPIIRRLAQEAAGGGHTNRAADLTEREMEILRLVVSGDPYKIIARKIGIREATVRTHVSNILSKLNLTNRSQLVIYSVKNQLF